MWTHLFFSGSGKTSSTSWKSVSENAFICLFIYLFIDLNAYSQNLLLQARHMCGINGE
jgi:hypothetical protein